MHYALRVGRAVVSSAIINTVRIVVVPRVIAICGPKGKVLRHLPENAKRRTNVGVVFHSVPRVIVPDFRPRPPLTTAVSNCPMEMVIIHFGYSYPTIWATLSPVAVRLSVVKRIIPSHISGTDLGVNAPTGRSLTIAINRVIFNEEKP